MTPTREELELYVSGNYDGDVDALERAITDDPALAAIVVKEATFEMLLRDAAAAATFCPACDALVPGERCDACGAAVRPGGYTVERVLVSNAHGRMYVARDADGKRVALKELAFVHAPTIAAISAFEREAKFLRALEHPAIPRFCASFEEGHGVHTRYYLAQELVEGRALEQLDDHWYSEAEIIDIAKQVLEILVYLQSLSPMVIHRDIKPANLLERPDASIALVDFGAAHVHGTTMGSTTIGTFGYMPIEQLAGIVDATTDVYALGASLLYLLTRQEPWRLAQTKTTVNVSAPLRAYLDKMVAADPRDRFASAKDALAALDRREVMVVKPARKRWSWTPALAAAAGIAFTLGGVGLYSYEQAHKRKQHRTAEPIAAGSSSSMAAFKPVGPTLHIAKQVSWSFDQTQLQDVMRLAANTCNVNIVVPQFIQAKVTANLTNVRCDQAIEVLLEAQGLWYSYNPEANLIRVGARKDIEEEGAADPTQPKLAADRELPEGHRVDLDVKDAPLRDVLQQLIKGEPLNLIVPDGIDGRVTVRFKGAPYNVAFETVLETQGLWYRKHGNIISVAARKDIDDAKRAP